jgi:hypothetical protein
MSAGNGAEPLPAGTFDVAETDGGAADNCEKDMNDELRITDEELRRATARHSTEGGGVDGETGELRNGFLALGASLEDLASRVDEEALAKELKRWSRTAEADAPTVAARGRSRDLTWQIVLGGALALSAVVVVAQIVRQWPGEGTVATPGAEIAKHGLSPQRNDAIEPRAKREDRGLAQEATQSGLYAVGPWQDALDYEIASAEAGMQRLASREGGLDGSLSEMNTQLQALSWEFWGGQL